VAQRVASEGRLQDARQREPIDKGASQAIAKLAGTL